MPVEQRKGNRRRLTWDVTHLISWTDVDQYVVRIHNRVTASVDLFNGETRRTSATHPTRHWRISLTQLTHESWQYHNTQLLLPKDSRSCSSSTQKQTAPNWVQVQDTRKGEWCISKERAGSSLSIKSPWTSCIPFLIPTSCINLRIWTPILFPIPMSRRPLMALTWLIWVRQLQCVSAHKNDDPQQKCEIQER